MPDAPLPPPGTFDVRIEDGRLTAIIHGPQGPIRTRISEAATRALYRMLGQHLEPGRFDGNG